MNLEDFITTSLVQIVKGVEKAAEQLADSTAIICPSHINTCLAENTNDAVYGFIDDDKADTVVQSVLFDVAVTVEKGTETAGGIGIRVGCIGVGSQGKSEKVDSSVSRLVFSVPVVLPSKCS